MSRAKRTGGVLVTAAFLLIGVAALAAPGDLDPSFSDDGRQETDVAGGNDRGQALAFQPNGRIVVAGLTDASGGARSFVTARYLSGGSLDNDFSTDGIDAFQPGDEVENNSSAFGVAIQPGGKIVVGGTAAVNAQGDFDFAVIRYLADGTLDNSFGDNGIRFVDFEGGVDRAIGMELQSDGRIVVGGSTQQGQASGVFALSRLTVDGTLDKSFSDDGKTTVDIPGSSNFDSPTALTVGSNDKITLVGQFSSLSSTGSVSKGSGTLGAPNVSSAVARFDRNGTLDPSLSDDGVLVFDVSVDEQDEPLDVTIDRSNRTLLAGTSVNEGVPNGYVARLLNDGTPDQNFGTDGVKILAVQRQVGVAVQVDGKIIAVGQNDDARLLVSRLKNDGSLDPSFGKGGQILVNEVRAGGHMGVGIDKANKIVVANSTSSNVPNTDLAVVRILSGLPPNCSLAGNASGNVLVGGAGRDYICGLGGNDRLKGKAGKDTLVGGPGADVLIGGPGDDTCLGGPGKDETINC